MRPFERFERFERRAAVLAGAFSACCLAFAAAFVWLAWRGLREGAADRAREDAMLAVVCVLNGAALLADALEARRAVRRLRP